MSGLDLWRFFFPVRVMAYGAAGAVGTRLSLRPLFVFFLLRRTVSLHPSGENPPRECGGVSQIVIARRQRVRAERGPMTGSAKQSSSRSWPMDCFGGVCRLAMTILDELAV